MKTAEVMLDGNAAAGLLASIFAFDVTMAIVTCASCYKSGPVAELRLYGTAAAAVLRCARCETVNMRILEIDTMFKIDLSGVARLDIARPN